MLCATGLCLSTVTSPLGMKLFLMLHNSFKKNYFLLLFSNVLISVTWAWVEVSPALISSITVRSRGCSRRCWWRTPGDDTWTRAEEEGCCWPVAVTAAAPETQPLDSTLQEEGGETLLRCLHNDGIKIIITLNLLFFLLGCPERPKQSSRWTSGSEQPETRWHGCRLHDQREKESCWERSSLWWMNLRKQNNEKFKCLSIDFYLVGIERDGSVHNYKL